MGYSIQYKIRETYTSYVFMNPVTVLEHMHINYSITNGYKRYITGPSSRMFMSHFRDASGFVPNRGTSKCNGLVSFQT